MGKEDMIGDLAELSFLQYYKVLSENREHVFFGCSSSMELWNRIRLHNVTTLMDDTDIWTTNIPAHLDMSLRSFVLLTILWRIWDTRNREVFRDEPSCSQRIISKVCDDLVIWQKRL